MNNRILCSSWLDSCNTSADHCIPSFDLCYSPVPGNNKGRMMECSGPHWCCSYQASYCKESCYSCMDVFVRPCIDGILQERMSMELTLDDAKTIAIALNVYNQKLVDENEKIRNTPEVSELIVMAAQKQYQELTE